MSYWLLFKAESRTRIINLCLLHIQCAKFLALLHHTASFYHFASYHKVISSLHIYLKMLWWMLTAYIDILVLIFSICVWQPLKGTKTNLHPVHAVQVQVDFLEDVPYVLITYLNIPTKIISNISAKFFIHKSHNVICQLVTCSTRFPPSPYLWSATYYLQLP